MTAPDHSRKRQIPLAPRAPPIHGTEREIRAASYNLNQRTPTRCGNVRSSNKEVLDPDRVETGIAPCWGIRLGGMNGVLHPLLCF